MLKVEMYARKLVSSLCQRYTVLRGACLTILAKNQIFLNEEKWDDRK